MCCLSNIQRLYVFITQLIDVLFGDNLPVVSHFFCSRAIFLLKRFSYWKAIFFFFFSNRLFFIPSCSRSSLAIVVLFLYTRFVQHSQALENANLKKPVNRDFFLFLHASVCVQWFVLMWRMWVCCFVNCDSPPIFSNSCSYEFTWC